MLRVHRSNALNVLADRLARVLVEPPRTESGAIASALEPDRILIQTAGVQRYLSRELSRRLGVLAGAEFPFPRAFLRDVLDKTLGPSEEARRYERQPLAWSIFRLLARERSGAAFSEVRRYLARDRDGSERFFLAERLASLFDQYLIYRPGLIEKWERGEEPEDFQAVLFREVREELGPHHFAARSRRFLEEVSDLTIREHLPGRISIVGGPGLPPRFLELFARLGRALDVELFSFSVCQEYFADAHPIDDPLPEVGEGLHPLLVSWGKVGADFQKLLERHEYVEASADYVLPEPKSVLAHLQRDLLEGRVRPDAERLGANWAADRSITLDSCHGPLREVEALHERLLGYFADDPTLGEEDVVVLVPEIHAYAPLVTAVFGARRFGERGLSFRVADRSERAENPAASAFLAALELLGGRFKASGVLDLLQTEPIRERFGFDALELERVAGWVSDAGIRWGLDEAHRAEFDLPEEAQNTWKHGIERLLLGFALADDGETSFRGVVPFDDVPARDGETLGRLVAVVRTLEAMRREATDPGRTLERTQRSPLAWCELLRAFVPRLIGASSTGAWSAESVLLGLRNLEERAREASAMGDVPFSLLVRLLADELTDTRPSTDFLAGGITFCELLPLRTIPFRVVCVLGLDQGKFPRSDRVLGFDRMQDRPLPGDRSIRADDRYLFLEMILAAGERLSLSYVGRSIQDNSEKPPSVLVTELSQVLDRMFAPGALAGSFLAARLHPLQPFSPSYFDGSRPELGESSSAWLAGARALVRTSKRPAPFLKRGLELPVTLERDLSLDGLVRFFKNPAAAYLEGLGVRLCDEVSVLEDREPVALGPLTRYVVGTRLLQDLTRGRETPTEIEVRRGELPQGTPGLVSLEELRETITELMALAEERLDEPREPLLFSLELGDIEGVPRTLRGSIDQLFGDRRVELTYGKLSPKRRLAAFLRHLAVSAAGGDVKSSYLVGRSDTPYKDDEEVIEYRPVTRADAHEVLREFVTHSVRGRRRALRFHPAPSWELFKRLFLGKAEATPTLEEIHQVVMGRYQDFVGRLRVTDEDLPLLHLFGHEDPFALLEASEGEEESEAVSAARAIFGRVREWEDLP